MPGAGIAITHGAALGVAGDDGGEASVWVTPKVIRGGGPCAADSGAPLGLSASGVTAAIATTATMPSVIIPDLYRVVWI